MAISPVKLYDSFSRTISSGWGTSDTGQGWSTFGTVKTHGVTSGYGYIDVPAGQGIGYKWQNYDTANPAVRKEGDTEVLVRMRWTGTNQWPLTDTGPIINRHPTDSTFYYASLQGYYGEASIGVSIKGYRYELDRKAIGLTKDTWYWVRFRRETDNVRIKLKIWEDTKAEPSSWLINTLLWTGNNPPQAGSSGFFVRGTTMSHQVRVSDYYVYTLEDVHPVANPSDTFDRTVTEGWGRSSSGHFWEGHVAVDPAIRTGRTGSVGSSAGQVTTADTTDRYGFLGTSLSGNRETYAEVSTTNGSATGFFGAGIRGNYTVVNGAIATTTGYTAQLATGSTALTIQKHNGTTLTQLGTFTLPFTVTNGVTYRVKIQAVGSTIRAKAWRTTDSEPNFQLSVTDSSYTSGRVFTRFDSSSTVSRAWSVGFIQNQAPSVDALEPVHKTTLGQLTQTSSTDTTISGSISYTDDENNSSQLSSLSVRKIGESAWQTALNTSTSVNRTTKTFTFTINDLERAVDYEVLANVTDADGVDQATGTSNVALMSTLGLAVKPTTANVASISGTEAVIEAKYSLDTNNNSTATLFRRETSRLVDVVSDTFSEIDGIYLQNHRINGTERWTKHQLTTAERNAILRNQQLRSGAISAEDVLLYYVTEQSPTEEYDVVADFFFPKTEGTVAILGRLHTTLLTAYGVRYNGELRQWELVRYDNGVATVLGTYAYDIVTPTIHNIRLVLRNAYKAVELDGVEVIRSTDNTIASGRAGYYATGITDGSADRYAFVDNFEQAYRTPSGSWLSVGSMTANRSTKTFSKTATGLALDTVYEFRIDFADVDGTTGSASLYTTGMTIGQAVQLKAVGATTQSTSAIVDIIYDYDSNDNSTVNILYRSTRNVLWQTINQTKITVARNDVKRFTTTLVGLRPATTYELRVVVSDPDGLIENSPRELSGLFTTRGVIEQVQKRTKHYLWKVYTPTNQYIGTLENVGDPEYTWQSNGGVTDLSARILSPIADSVNGRNPLVAHQNRVDVWVLDPASNGLGPNLIQNGDCDEDVGGWTLGTNWSYASTGGPDGSNSLRFSQTGSTSEYETESVPILLGTARPLSVKAICRAIGGKLSMYVMAFNRNEQQIDVSQEQGETVGNEWQELKIEYTPPQDTFYLRVIFRNRGAGTMWADKVEVHPKEALVYRGMIESYTPTVDQNSQYTDVQILGLVSLLSDDYVDHLQYVRTQPQKDTLAQRPNRGPADPATMMRDLVDIARQQNPRCSLYYTDDSIKPTGTIAEYTFRDQQLRACFDKVRGLCPPDWHYFIDPDGLVNLRGPQHVTTHVLKANVHIMNFSIERSIRNLKNYVRIKGRQDEDGNEPDGHGSINYVAFDQASIDRYGKRVLFIRDAQITTPDTAELFGDGRLEEYNREEQRAQCVIPDEKSIDSDDSMLIGYNIESFRPGDMVKILDPVSGARNTYWDKFIWNFDQWNSAINYVPLPTTVPIKEVQIHGAEARIELSERQPSGVSDYGRLARWLSLQNNDNG